MVIDNLIVMITQDMPNVIESRNMNYRIKKEEFSELNNLH